MAPRDAGSTDPTLQMEERGSEDGPGRTASVGGAVTSATGNPHAREERKAAGQQPFRALLPPFLSPRPLTPRQHPLGLPEGTARLLPPVDLHRRGLPPPGQDLRADEAQRRSQRVPTSWGRPALLAAPQGGGQAVT